jgi:dTDP-4-dehydrorhamnose 3,5-epimerase
MGRPVRAADTRTSRDAMNFVAAGLSGLYVIEPQRIEDDRGFFARTFCEEEFAAHGLKPHFVQCNISFNARKGTLRGMHFQAEPHAEAKLVRCTQGAIFDVAVDLIKDSPTYLQWKGFELSAENRRMLYLPEGYAHGFQTLADNCEVFYQMSENYHPASARGARWNDPAFAIVWPLQSPIISARDAGYPDFHS